MGRVQDAGIGLGRKAGRGGSIYLPVSARVSSITTTTITTPQPHRLQFMEGNECCYADPGGAALSITVRRLVW